MSEGYNETEAVWRVVRAADEFVNGTHAEGLAKDLAGLAGALRHLSVCQQLEAQRQHVTFGQYVKSSSGD